MMILGYIAAGLVGLFLLGNFFTFVIQDLFIFRPIKLKRNYTYSFDIPFEELFFKTPHHGEINALWFHRKDQKRPLVLYCHGNSSNLSRWGHLGAYFDELGCDLFIYDYRGFGKSRGPANEKNFIKDANVLFAFADEHYETEDIILFGRSFGSGPACHLAAENTTRLLILETPYYSVRNLFKTYYPFLPVFLFRFKYNFNNHLRIPKIDIPIHIFHGTKDIVVPLRCAQRLEPLLKADSGFHIITGAKHKDLADYPEYHDLLQSLIQKSATP